MATENKPYHQEEGKDPCRPDEESDVGKLWNRMHPPGILSQASAFFGGDPTSGWVSAEDGAEITEDDDPKRIADLLSLDDERAISVLRLLDSTESYTDFAAGCRDLLPEFSMESFSDIVKKALEAVIAWLKTLPGTIFGELANLELVARYLEFKAQNLKVLARDKSMSMATPKAPLIIDTRIQSLAVRYKPVQDIQALLTGLRIMQNTITTYYDYAGGLVRQAERLVAAFGNYDNMHSVMSDASPASLARSNAFFPAQGVSDVYNTPHLLGCVRLQLTFRDNGDRLRLIQSDVIDRPLPPSIEFRRFNLQASDQCLDMIIAMSQYLQKQNTIAIRKRRIDKINQLTGQLERLNRQFNNTESNDLLRDQRAQITQIEHFVDWFSNPYRELYGNTCRTLRAALNVCERNAM